MASRRLWAWFAIVAMGLAGCATVVRSDRDVVAERAQERWDLLVKNDFAAAHGYISPAGRELVTPEAYASSLRKNFWTGAKVGPVRITRDMGKTWRYVWRVGLPDGGRVAGIGAWRVGHGSACVAVSR